MHQDDSNPHGFFGRNKTEAKNSIRSFLLAKHHRCATNRPTTPLRYSVSRPSPLPRSISFELIDAWTLRLPCEPGATIHRDATCVVVRGESEARVVLSDRGGFFANWPGAQLLDGQGRVVAADYFVGDNFSLRTIG